MMDGPRSSGRSTVPCSTAARGPRRAGCLSQSSGTTHKAATGCVPWSPKPPDLKRIRDREHYLPGWVSHLELWSHPVLVSDAHGSLEKPVRAYSVSNSLVPEQAAALLASFEVPPLRFRTDAGVVTQTRFEVKGWWLEIQGADVDPSPLVFCVHNPHYITTCRTSIESRSECGRTEGANRSPRQALDCPRRCGKAAQYLPRQCELNSRR